MISIETTLGDTANSGSYQLNAGWNSVKSLNKFSRISENSRRYRIVEDKTIYTEYYIYDLI